MTPMERIEGELQEAQQRIAELETDCAAHKAAENAQIALRQKMESERDALAAHMERLRGLVIVSCGELLSNSDILDMAKDLRQQAEGHQ